MQYGGEIIFKNSKTQMEPDTALIKSQQFASIHFCNPQDSKQNWGKQVFGAPLVIFGVWDFFGFLWFIAEVIVLARTRSSL